jgi:hypothetical protein
MMMLIPPNNILTTRLQFPVKYDTNVAKRLFGFFLPDNQAFKNLTLSKFTYLDSRSTAGRKI